jgi:acetate---CoA ligase (ADP-forming) subunit beta
LKQIEAIISDALSRGQVALSEYDSLRLLNLAGVPTVDSRFAANVDEAIAAAGQIGYPVALKGTGAKLMHKTEIGVVRLGLADDKAVSHNVREITERAGDLLEGFIVAPMINSARELIAGFLRDPSFGPAVMFGVGGIAAEAIKNVVFRLAPLTPYDAIEMISEIKAVGMLDDFRGLPAIDRNALASSLVTLGNLGISYDAIREIDINPLLIEGDKPVAADALVVLKQ